MRVAACKQTAQSSRHVPLFVAAARLGETAGDSRDAALALATLARVGECGNRLLREAVARLPVLPASEENTFGTLPDVLPLYPALVRCWCKRRRSEAVSVREGRSAVLVRGMVDSLNFLFCAVFFR